MLRSVIVNNNRHARAILPAGIVWIVPDRPAGYHMDTRIAKKSQFFACINRHNDQYDFVGAPLAGALIPRSRKGCPYGSTFCGNIYRVYKRRQKLVKRLLASNHDLIAGVGVVREIRVVIRSVVLCKNIDGSGNLVFRP